ncbi:ABC transporter permease [Gemmatimonadota bacterium]
MRRDRDLRGRGTLLFRLLLRLCPITFRQEVGHEALSTHQSRREEIGRTGSGKQLIFLIRELFDLSKTMLREWKFRLSGDTGFNTRAEWETVTSMAQMRTPAPPPIAMKNREPEMLKNSLNDLRYALRSMLRRPGFSIVVVLTLAIGIGATTAVFSVLEGVLLRALPYPEANRLVVPQTHEDDFTYNITINDFLVWQDQEVFESVALFGASMVDITGMGDPFRVTRGVHSNGYFDVLRLKPILGRTFSEEEHLPGGGNPVVIGYGFWQRIYGGSQDVLGSTFMFRGITRTVVGVMPPEAGVIQGAEVWEPFQTTQTEPIIPDWDNHAWSAIGRLKDGMDLRSTNDQLAAIAARITADYPDLRGNESIIALPLNDWMTGTQLNRSLWLLFGLVGFVLLIGCVNIANLLMASGSERFSELNVRRALGAGRGRLIRQLLTENLLLALTGGIAGVLLSRGMVGLILLTLPSNLPRLSGIGLNPAVLTFALAASIGSVLFFGLIPAFRSTSKQAGLQTGSNHRTATIGRADRRSRNILIGVELAFSLILLSGAGLTLRSLGNMQAVDPGFDHQNLLTVSIELPMENYPPGEAVMGFYSGLHKRLTALPGIISSTFRSFLPLNAGGFNLWRSFLADGRPEPPAGEELSGVPWSVVGDDHFQTLVLPVVKGRAFDETDNAETTPVIIVNEEFARRMFGEEEALGKRVRSWRDENIYREIVGIVSNVRFLGPADAIRPMVYVPHRQNQWRSLMLIARTMGPPNEMFAPIRDVIGEMDPDLPVVGTLTMDEALYNTMASTRTMATLLGAFSLAALILAAVGIFGVLSYVVASRKREIGIRIAVGADRASVMRLILQDTLKVTGIGLLFGVVGSFFLGRLLQSQLFEVSPGDPVTLIAVALVLTGTAILASLIPAHRAATVDPIEALRQE